MFRLLPGIDKEISAQPQHHRGRKEPHDGIGVRHIHKKHSNHKNRKREDYRPNGPFFSRWFFSSWMVSKVSLRTDFSSYKRSEPTGCTGFCSWRTSVQFRRVSSWRL